MGAVHLLDDARIPLPDAPAVIHAAPYAQAIYVQLATMFGQDITPLLAFAVDITPIAKERPRLGARGRTFTPERTRTAEEHLAWAFKLAMQGSGIARPTQPIVGNLGMVAVFYRPDRRRIDGDNMIKLVCDAGNLARVWGDDSQITTKLARVELDKARPRTEIAIGPMASTLTR